jgi:hypothetical protein
VDVVVFADLYAKYMKWLDNGVPVLVTAMVKDTGGVAGGRSASLQSAEQEAQHIDDEYGGHPEMSRARVSAYELRIGDADEDRDPKELEREKYGDRKENLDLFGAPQAPAAEEDFNDAVASLEEAPAAAEEPRNFASHAAAFGDSPITPELNALEIVPLDGIREKKVREIAIEVKYQAVTDDTVKRIREIVEEHAGEIPITVTIVDLPADVAASAGQPHLRLKLNHHFRVQPGDPLRLALAEVKAEPRYVF